MSATFAYSTDSRLPHGRQQLCELAAREQDPDHLMELIRAIHRLLDEKEQQLDNSYKQAVRRL
jgi:hypothetical protein